MPTSFVEEKHDATHYTQVLMHPNEARRSLGTGWILPRCVRRCAVVTSRAPTRALQTLLRLTLPRSSPVYLMYPAHHAVGRWLQVESVV